MSTSTRLTKLFKESDEILFDNKSRFVFLSDCHRGDNSRADNFSPNSSIYLSALDYYHGNGFTYIELGDGDELWENDRFSDLKNAHKDAYLSIRKFYKDDRFIMIYGNHDIMKQRRRFVQKNLYDYYNPGTGTYEPLYDGIKVHEGLILRYRGTPYSIFVVHGHQGDLMNDLLWPLSRFLVRYVWRNIEALQGWNPMSPARSSSRLNSVEYNLIRWVKANNQMLIAGHTHNTAFPRPGQAPYFNDGCCVNRGHITGIEIQDGEIMLVKWSRKTENGAPPVISRSIIAGPEKIEAYFK